MSVRDLILWGTGNAQQVPGVFHDRASDPFLALHREVNRFFDDVFRGFGLDLPSFHGASFAAGSLSLRISDDETEITVLAEIFGLEEKDIEVLLENGLLILNEPRRIFSGLILACYAAMGSASRAA